MMHFTIIKSLYDLTLSCTQFQAFFCIVLKYENLPGATAYTCTRQVLEFPDVSDAVAIKNCKLPSTFCNVWYGPCGLANVIGLPEFWVYENVTGPLKLLTVGAGTITSPVLLAYVKIGQAMEGP